MGCCDHDSPPQHCGSSSVDRRNDFILTASKVIMWGSFSWAAAAKGSQRDAKKKPNCLHGTCKSKTVPSCASLLHLTNWSEIFIQSYVGRFLRWWQLVMILFPSVASTSVQAIPCQECQDCSVSRAERERVQLSCSWTEATWHAAADLPLAVPSKPLRNSIHLQIFCRVSWEQVLCS